MILRRIVRFQNTPSVINKATMSLPYVSNDQTYLDQVPKEETTLFQVSDIKKMNEIWQEGQRILFKKTIVETFVNILLDLAISTDVKSQMIEKINLKTRAKDLWVDAGIVFPRDHVFTDPEFSGMTMTIQRLLFRTDALEMLAKNLGPQIKVDSYWKADGPIRLKIQFFPA